MKNNRHFYRRSLFSALALVFTGFTTHQQAIAGPSFQVGDQGYMEINYAVQIWSQYRGYTSPTNDGDVYDTFLRRNRVTFLGQYNDYVGFYAQLEAGNDSKSGNDDRSIFYRDAYLTLDYNDAVRFIVGRYKNTFSRENLEACLEPLTLDRGENLPYTPWAGTRDTGATIWGNLADAMFQYRVSIGDGREGEYVVKSSPRITARAHLSLLDPEYSYGYRGTYLGTQIVLTIGASYDTQADVAYGNFTARTDAKDYQAYTYDIFFEYPYSFGTITASAAYMEYSLDDYPVNPDPEMTPWAERDGGYIKAGYLFPKPLGIGRLQLFARGEEINYGSGVGLSDQTWNSIGANYYINGQQLKATFEYAQIEFDQQDPTNAALQDYDQATLALQMIF